MLKVTTKNSPLTARTAPTNAPSADNSFKEKMRQAESQKGEPTKLYARTGKKVLQAAIDKEKNKSDKSENKEKTNEKYEKLAEELERYLCEAEGKPYKPKTSHTKEETKGCGKADCAGKTDKTDKTDEDSFGIEDIFQKLDDIGYNPLKDSGNPLDPAFLKMIINHPKTTPKQKAAARDLLKHHEHLNKPGVKDKVLTAHTCDRLRKEMTRCMISMLLMGQSLV